MDLIVLYNFSRKILYNFIDFKRIHIASRILILWCTLVPSDETLLRLNRRIFYENIQAISSELCIYMP